MLKVPGNYKNCGIKVYCTKCKRELTSNEKCSTGKSIKSCNYKDKHKYKLLIHVPNTRNSRRTKVIKSKDFNIALLEMSKFKSELITANYHKVAQITKVKEDNKLIKLITDYLDFQSGENIPSHLIRKRSKDHINDCRRALERLCKSLKNFGYSLSNLDVKELDDKEVGIYHDYLISELNLSKITYNKHFRIMNSFYSWLNDFKKMSLPNPFNRVELATVTNEKNMITEKEFNELLKITNYENGWTTRGEQKRNVYQEWLVTGFRLGLETGLRREELITLKWSDLKWDFENNGFSSLNNKKVDRIQFGEVTGKNTKPILKTKGLMNLLMKLGYDQKKGTNEYIIERPAELSDSHVMDSLSRGFSHFIKKVSDRKLEFKDLRKTYITKITMIMGNDAKLFTGHSNNAVLKNHYLSQAYLAGNLVGFSIF